MNGFDYESSRRTWHLVLTSELRNALYMHACRHILFQLSSQYDQLVYNSVGFKCNVGVEKNQNDSYKLLHLQGI